MKRQLSNAHKQALSQSHFRFHRKHPEASVAASIKSKQLWDRRRREGFEWKPLEERFWEKVKKGKDDECWPWIGAKRRDGTGWFYLGARFGRNIAAHHVAYALDRGLEIGNMNRRIYIIFKCGNSSCVNPEHLVTSTSRVALHYNPVFANERFSITFPERFWKKVHKTNGCWLWKSNLDFYGVISRGADTAGRIKSHCASWILHTGAPIPSGMQVLHHCDNKRCVRFDHLYIGHSI